MSKSIASQSRSRYQFDALASQPQSVAFVATVSDWTLALPSWPGGPGTPCGPWHEVVVNNAITKNNANDFKGDRTCRFVVIHQIHTRVHSW